MKKTFLLFALMAGAASATQAQGIRYGIKGGASLTNFSGESSDFWSHKYSFHAGVLANFAFNDMISVQPEVQYSQKGAKVSSNGDYHLNLNYIDVPVLVKVATGATGLFFEAGPQIGFLASSKIKDGSTSADFKDYTHKVDFGYAAGLGFQVANGAMLGVRYNGGFTNVGKSFTTNSPFGPVTTTATNTKNSVFQLYVGYLFGGK